MWHVRGVVERGQVKVRVRLSENQKEKEEDENCSTAAAAAAGSNQWSCPPENPTQYAAHNPCSCWETGWTETKELFRWIMQCDDEHF